MSWAEAFTRAVSYLVGQVIAFGAAASIVGLGLLIADSATERESETGQRIGYVLMGLGVLVGIVLEFAVFLKAIVDALIDKLQLASEVASPSGNQRIPTTAPYLPDIQDYSSLTPEQLIEAAEATGATLSVPGSGRLILNHPLGYRLPQGLTDALRDRKVGVIQSLQARQLPH